ncbi:FecCD family ABC transporter permease [Bryobacter aggregatus]|uniref:FecCD family ABC transporter permease n=1 Tax=Bryobacter aggregatus TaxID=360054 RepID=UPI0004E1D776|nr:iron ABC transporter permease [Bryobacter aggregatus]
MAVDSKRRAITTLLVSALAALAALAICPFLGGSGMDYGKLWRQESPDWAIFLNLRLPRAILALLSGGALASSGAMFQALLRDALATPDNLGVTAAASLGAVLSISLLDGAETSFPVVWLAAVAGAGLVALLISALAATRKFSPMSLLLTGIAVNAMCAAVIMLLHSLAGITRSFQITHWLMGGIDAVPYSTLAILALILTPLCFWVLLQARVLNVISFGETWAMGRGIDARKKTWQGFLVGTLLVGTTTAITGPIAFVGLIVPHLLRRMVGPDYRVLLPASLFGGGAFLILCDTIARTVLAPAEIPVGVITALLGGPFFVWLLWSR